MNNNDKDVSCLNIYDNVCHKCIFNSHKNGWFNCNNKICIYRMKFKKMSEEELIEFWTPIVEEKQALKD